MGRTRLITTRNPRRPARVAKARRRRPAPPWVVWSAAALAAAALWAASMNAHAQSTRPATAPPAGSTQQERQSPSQQAVEVYLSQDALQLMYSRPMDMGEFGRNEARAGVFINEQRDLIAVADVLVDVGERRRRPNWALQVGPRAYGALMADENQDVFSIAFGGRLSYFLGRNRQTAVSLEAFYAPDIVTFGNADEVKDVSVRFETALTERTRIFVGYRVFEFDLEIDREVDDNMHLGIRHRF